MQLVGRSCDHCRDAIRIAHEALGCARCGLAVHVRCTSASAGYRGRVSGPSCMKCGAALETGVTPDTAPPPKSPPIPVPAVVVGATLLGVFAGAWATVAAPFLGPLDATFVGGAVTLAVGALGLVARAT